METQIISGPTEVITNKNVEFASGSVLLGGMLRPGEEVGGVRVDSLLSTSGGEAEIYLCKKGGENFVLKYYYTKKANREAEAHIRTYYLFRTTESIRTSFLQFLNMHPAALWMTNCRMAHTSICP